MIISLLLAAMTQTVTPPAPPPGGPAGLRRADANGDGIVTRAEAMAQANGMFARMDSNHDGKVTPEERRAAMEAMRAERRGDGIGRGGRGRGMGGGMGSGGDRELTLEQSRQMAANRFDRLDTNKDGRLDAAELAAARPGPRPPRGDDAPPPPAQ
ncbi:hypothetical protein [Sphingomonas mollis]|uniref:EF-hand domain-containing protein n=1 Tax=Sphingomonas mollis TaxID=2795726 RepID=A0ABS0XLN3_9SPHN|nr:hypothetical protein [Sphingomonas sp. BT553]MBJ6120932.1 hypothetical protein [Sphingomonas sp. BT553]